jgi:hypothetical protein
MVQESTDERTVWEIQDKSKKLLDLTLNQKMDGMEVQPYSDWFTHHHISFLYWLTYLSNNTKMIRKYEKTKPKFSEILPIVFTLSQHPIRRKLGQSW